MMDAIAGVLVLIGGVFAFIAGLGILRLPDLLNRMHASTKAGTLGSSLALVAAAVHFDGSGVTVRVVMTILLLLLTAPIAAHMLGRAAVRVRSRTTQKSSGTVRR